MLNLNKKSTHKEVIKTSMKFTLLRKLPLVFMLAILPFFMNAQNVNVWAASASGGVNGNGIISKINIKGNSHKLAANTLDLNLNSESSEVLNPNRGLVDGNDGYLYGTTLKGGINDVGVFYKVDKSTNDLEIVSDIDFLTYPGVAISMDEKSEKVYGFATYGGKNNKGSIFCYDKDFNEYKELYAWTDALKGAKPMGIPVIHNGFIYGVTEYGGEFESGVLFSYSIDDEELFILKNFEEYETGGKPYSEFVIHDNRIYGTTKLGGRYDGGTIYCYDLNNNKFSKMYDFIKSDGKGGRSLTMANDTYLVGSTVRGGEYDLGVLFTFNISTRAYTKKIDFDYNNNGANPEAKLVETDKYQFVGYTTSGGANGAGVYFSYDLEKNELTKQFDFEKEDGTNTNFNSLVVVKTEVVEKENAQTTSTEALNEEINSKSLIVQTDENESN